MHPPKGVSQPCITQTIANLPTVNSSLQILQCSVQNSVKFNVAGKLTAEIRAHQVTLNLRFLIGWRSTFVQAFTWKRLFVDFMTSPSTQIKFLEFFKCLFLFPSTYWRTNKIIVLLIGPEVCFYRVRFFQNGGKVGKGARSAEWSELIAVCV